jgi:hypothetical protein
MTRQPPFDPRAELSQLAADHEAEIGEAAYTGGGYMDRMVLDTTPGVRLDDDGAMSYSSPPRLRCAGAIIQKDGRGGYTRFTTITTYWPGVERHVPPGPASEIEFRGGFGLVRAGLVAEALARYRARTT